MAGALAGAGGVATGETTGGWPGAASGGSGGPTSAAICSPSDAAINNKKVGTIAKRRLITGVTPAAQSSSGSGKRGIAAAACPPARTLESAAPGRAVFLARRATNRSLPRPAGRLVNAPPDEPAQTSKCHKPCQEISGASSGLERCALPVARFAGFGYAGWRPRPWGRFESFSVAVLRRMMKFYQSGLDTCYIALAMACSLAVARLDGRNSLHCAA